MSVLRPLEPADHSFVLELNELEVDVLAPMDAERLGQVLGWSRRADVIEHEGRPIGFVVTIDGRADYESDNFVWHRERFAGLGVEDFVYLDRVVLAPDARGRGLATLAYDELEADAAATGWMALEVNAEPANVPSLRFHDKRGYVEVGRAGGDGKVVSMLVKDLGPSGERSAETTTQ